MEIIELAVRREGEKGRKALCPEEMGWTRNALRGPRSSFVPLEHDSGRWEMGTEVALSLAISYETSTSQLPQQAFTWMPAVAIGMCLSHRRWPGIVPPLCPFLISLNHALGAQRSFLGLWAHCVFSPFPQGIVPSCLSHLLFLLPALLSPSEIWSCYKCCGAFFGQFFFLF